MTQRAEEIVAGIKVLPKGNVNWAQVREWIDQHLEASVAEAVAQREREVLLQLAGEQIEAVKERDAEIERLRRDNDEARREERERWRGLADKLLAFDVSPTFDAKGSYSQRKSEELARLKQEAAELCGPPASAPEGEK